MFPLMNESTWLYTGYEIFRSNFFPLRVALKLSDEVFASPSNIWRDHPNMKYLDALNEVGDRLTRVYEKPNFGIIYSTVNNKLVSVDTEIVLEKDFCNLIHFKKSNNENSHKLLIVAPLSGHYSTLLRGTVEGLLPHFDVYITDWINPRDIPLYKGKFDLDDYIDYCIEFMNFLEEDYSVMGVCQPSVPVSAAVALMSDQPTATLPKNFILIGGPIDTRISPTSVNTFAATRSMNWFEDKFITRVPVNYSGCGRLVYPGFLQLAGFMSMNMKRHLGEHKKLFEHLVIGDEDSVDAHTKFYDEYLSVMDLPAEFYLQTIESVFKKNDLAVGTFISRGRKIDLGEIKRSALLVIEGEHDDITGLGQTKAAIELCHSIPDSRKYYHLQKGVGHYGLFNGSKYYNSIVPLIVDYVCRHR